ncbi:hypothetical protein [Humibacter sp. RRB41]|uniref:hypothetical protein n=1 Tax=Humibacter sp. RRB41 TaxID=2919946 RepID=UPI001FAB226A|nr:hypothetical protein [Humibacter sp. RRB41]
MSLLTAPRHVVTVQNRQQVEGSIGQNELVNDGAPVKVRGNKHPLSSDEIVSFGLRDFVTMSFHSLSWPGSPLCVVTFDGAEWDQVGEAQLYDMSPSTRHFEVILRKRNSTGGT